VAFTLACTAAYSSSLYSWAIQRTRSGERDCSSVLYGCRPSVLSVLGDQKSLRHPRQMGDPSPPSDSQSHQAANNPSSRPFSNVQSPDSDRAFLEAQQLSDNQSDFNQQVSPMYVSPQHAFAAQMDLAHGQGHARMAPYNMSALANTLPQTSYRTQQFVQPQQQRPLLSVSSPGMAAGLQLGPLPGQQHLHTMQNQAYYLPQQPQLAQYYGGSMPSTQQQQNPSPPLSGMGMYNNPMLMNQQQPSQASSFYYPPQYMQSSQAVANRMLLQRYMASAPSSIDPRLSQAPGPLEIQSSLAPSSLSQQSFNPATRSNVVRGPPRKPRQSGKFLFRSKRPCSVAWNFPTNSPIGHAIWIGNLPPQTDLMSLVYHVCKEAPGLDSLFLISKSNCAFANYKDEQTCAAAQQKLHDSKFQSVRLVSRLRKSAVENAAGISAPTGPASSTTRPPTAETTQIPAAVDQDKTSVVTPQVGGISDALPMPIDVSQQKDKFYILKSLTVDDLELSVRTGIWATQSHNETALNKAFEVSLLAYSSPINATEQIY
jgi:hypothetical protein